MAFQATFCIITTALVSGAVVERMRFGPFLVFAALWSVLVYAVLAHWAFGGGWLQAGGTLDFAGGVPVEMASGFSALAAALVVGARKDYGRQALLPHNAVYVLLGAGLLWFGWFGFNGGSGLDARAASACSPSSTRCSRPACALRDLVRARPAARAQGDGDRRGDGDHRRLRRRSRPPAGYISPGWAMALGVVAALPSYAIIMWRPRTHVDETLDVLGAHGIAGLTGMLFIGLVAQVGWNGGLGDGLLYGNADQFLLAGASPSSWRPVYAFGMTFALLKLIGARRAAARERARRGARPGRREPRRGGVRRPARARCCSSPTRSGPSAARRPSPPRSAEAAARA